MTQKRFDWIVGDWPPHIAASGGVQSFFVSYQTANNIVYHLVAETDVAAKNDRLRVERVVGQVFGTLRPFSVTGTPAQWPDGSLVFVHERLYVSEVQGAGAITDTLTQDLANVNSFLDADRNFMWHRVHLLDIGGADSSAEDSRTFTINDHGVQGDGAMHYSAIDCRVKRVLTGRQVLVYQVGFEPHIPGQDTDSVFNGLLQWYAHLRVGVKF